MEKIEAKIMKITQEIENEELKRKEAEKKQQAQKRMAEYEISQTEKMIKELNRMGIEPGETVNILDSAKTEFYAGQYQNTIQICLDCKTMINRLMQKSQSE